MFLMLGLCFLAGALQGVLASLHTHGAWRWLRS
jgi:hypothetical protein